MILLVLIFALLALTSSEVFSQRPSVFAQRLLQSQPSNQNLLRIDSPTVTSCNNFSGPVCIQCKQGFTLTNGKCYQTIANCLVQYTNICSSCQQGYRPVTSVQNVLGQPSTFTVTCVPVSTPQINSSGNSVSQSVNPLVLLGRQSFISWNNIEIRYPTDVYLVMIWNFLDGNSDLRVKIDIKSSVLTSSVRGKVLNLTDKLTITNWAVQNQFANFLQGHLVDIQNIYFYRLRYKERVTQNEYEVLTMIHEVNFQITLLQHLLVSNVNGTGVGNGPVVSATLNESDQVKALRQEILDLKIEASQERQTYKQRQLLLLISSGYALFSPTTIQTDPGCQIIKNFIDNKFSEFISVLGVSSLPNPGVYAWMNMQLNKVYYKRNDNVDREYIYEIQFTDDVVVLVQFVLGRMYEIVQAVSVYNK